MLFTVPAAAAAAAVVVVELTARADLCVLCSQLYFLFYIKQYLSSAENVTFLLLGSFYTGNFL